MPRKKSTKSTTYEQSAHDKHYAEIQRQETCEGCGTHYPGSYNGSGPRKRGYGNGTPGGFWVFDCCDPNYYDEEVRGENDERTA